MAKSKKYYVVWEGRAPGIYTDWDECKAQIENWPGAKYKSFPDQDAATEAFRSDPGAFLIFKAMARHAKEEAEAGRTLRYADNPAIAAGAWAVDAACAGNPGPMEYRCVRVDDGTEVFHLGPLDDGTNNIGEYLAIIHAAALLAQRGDTRTPIYSDSRIAQSWVRNRGSRTKLEHTPRNARIFELLARADRWIQTHTIPNPILKWDTDAWGEIPADFGRKH